MEHKVEVNDFNTFGARRGNHEVMMRGTFGNGRIKNLLADKIGPYTKEFPSGKETWIYDTYLEYSRRKQQSVIICGKEYGTGSSRDWAAKGPYLLGVKAVVAESFERIHRSNLIGMGVLPLQFKKGRGFASLDMKVSSPVNIKVESIGKPSSNAYMIYRDSNGDEKREELTSRLDTEVECHYYLNGGILQYVMRRIMKR